MSTDTPPHSSPAGADAKSAGQGITQVLVELGPAIVFMVSYNVVRRSDPENAIFWATGLFMAATTAALAYAWFIQKRTPPMLLVTAAIVLVFGGLTLALHDEFFAYIKPTIINGLFATAIFGGLMIGRNVWRMLFESAFQLPTRVWNILAVRWGFFYIFLAVLNELLWRSICDVGPIFGPQRCISEGFWANFKLLGVMPITFAFLLANLPITMKYLGKSDEEAAAMDAKPKA